MLYDIYEAVRSMLCIVGWWQC